MWQLVNIKFYCNIISDDLATAKEKVKLALIVSDCDDDEMLKKSRHERRRRKISSPSDNENDDNTTEIIEKNSSFANKKLSKKLPTNMSLNVQSSSKKVENTGTNGNVSIFKRVFIPDEIFCFLLVNNTIANIQLRGKQINFLLLTYVMN